jgi:uncharacterized protein (DUF1499 family)
MKKLFLGLFLLLFTQCSGKVPNDLGIRNNQFKECPPTPNCVNSFADKKDKDHFIEPISYNSSFSDELSRLKKVILAQPRTKIIEDKGNYIRAEFTTLIMRYVDDVEFSFDDNLKLIQVRSASRLGRSDLGVNRKRIEMIRSELKRSRGE